MADEISKKVLIQIDLSDDEANAAVTDLKNKVDSLKAAVISNKQAISDAKTAQSQFNAEIAKGKLEQQNIKTAIDQARLANVQATAEVKASKAAYVSASGSYDEAQKKLTALGRAIKSAEDGFKSTDPAIKAQIKSYNQLNGQLKAFDAQLGNHQRKIGQYENALKGLSGSIGSMIPGYNQFASIIQNTAQAFNAMGSGAKTAAAETAELGGAAEGSEAALGGLSAASAIAVGAFAAVAAAILSVITYLKSLDGITDTTEQLWAGLKASFFAAGSSIQNGQFADMSSNMLIAASSAAGLKEELQDLGDAQLSQSVKQQKADEQIALLQLKLKDKRNTPAQEKQYFNEIQKISQDNFEIQKRLADTQYDLAIRNAEVGRYLSQEEQERLRTEGVSYAIQLENDNKILSGQTKAIADAQKAQIEAARANEVIQQRAQNRMDSFDMKAEASAQKELELIAKLKQEAEQANSDRIASMTRTLEFRQSSFSKELSQTEEHYRQLIFKRQEFIEKEQHLINSKKSSPKVKAAARLAINANQNDITQLQAEKNAATEKLMMDHAKVMYDETQKAANDLAKLQNQGISDQRSRVIYALNEDYKEKQEALDKELLLYRENQRKIVLEMATASPEREKILVEDLVHQQELFTTAAAKKTEEQIQFNQTIKKTNKEFDLQNKLLQDQINIINAGNKKGFSGGKENSFNTGLEKAELQQNKDEQQKSLQDKGLQGDKNKDGSEFSPDQITQKLAIVAGFEQQRSDIEKKFRQGRINDEVQAAQLISNTGFQIIGNALQRQNQAQELAINKQKDYDLQNQALTSTQKYIINEKYRIKQGQQKVKEFRSDQALSAAKAAINTAESATKVSWNPIQMAFVIAAGIAEEAVILTQKPPAYAYGGIHYTSDGRGGVLSGYSKTDNTNAYLRSGEAVVVSEAMQNPWARNMVSAINQSFGGRPYDSTVSVRPWSTPGFASGGVYLPTSDNGLRATIPGMGTSRMHPDDINSFAAAVSNIQFPAISVDVKDVNRQQGLLATVQDRSSR